MPRNKRQFSFLERALKVAGIAPTAGSTLDNYLKFKSGAPGHKRNAGKIHPDARILISYSIVPFGGPGIELATTPDKRYKVNLSKFSNDWRGTKVTNADIGYDVVNTLNQSAANYYPAQMKVFVPDDPTAPKTTKISGITKRGYKSRAGKSYTLPFGAIVTKTAQNEYREQMKFLSDKAVAAGAKSVTFVPEEWTSPEKVATPGT